MIVAIIRPPFRRSSVSVSPARDELPSTDPYFKTQKKGGNCRRIGVVRGRIWHFVADLDIWSLVWIQRFRFFWIVVHHPLTAICLCGSPHGLSSGPTSAWGVVPRIRGRQDMR